MLAPRLMSARLVGSVMTVVVVAACASDTPGPTTDFEEHAVAAAACGPADGPAVAIYLSSTPVESLEPSAPHVRIAVWQPLERLRGRSWSLAPDRGEGGAWLHRTAQDFEIATSGTVTVNAVTPDSTVEGSVDVTFPGARRYRSSFRAVWRSHPESRPLLCG